MIETIKLSKHFGSIKAVDNLSFKVERGEVLGFLGPNGAGKSTTMKMLTCFLAPSSGTAKLNGHDIIDDPMAVKQVVGYLPESAPAYGEMTPLSFLQFIGRIRGFSGSALDKAVDRVIEETNLQSVRHQAFETLSKGYKRRVCLAQSIIHDPPILIMDEPTDGLDPNQKHEVRSLISKMGKDKVIILSTHILEEVDAVCTRAVIIGHGRLLADGTPHDLKQKSRHHGAVTLSVRGGDLAGVESTLQRVPFVDKVEALDGAADGARSWRLFPIMGKAIAAGVTELAREKKWDVTELHVEQGHLDEVFRTLTTRKPSKDEPAVGGGEGEKAKTVVAKPEAPAPKAEEPKSEPAKPGEPKTEAPKAEADPPKAADEKKSDSKPEAAASKPAPKPENKGGGGAKKPKDKKGEAGKAS